MIHIFKRKIKKMIRHTKHCYSVLKLSKDKKKHIYYFGVPMHPNMGDLAQCVCIREFLHSNYPNHEVIEIDTKVFMHSCFPLRKFLKKWVREDELIFFQSGYCTQDIGGIEDLMHQAVMIDYPENKLIILPQTVFFQSKTRENQSSLIYNQHNHLLFLARDQISYDLACRMFPDRPVFAYPDIVTTLIGKETYCDSVSFNERKGILMCMRNDVEKFYSIEEIDCLKKHLEKFESVSMLDTTVGDDINSTTEGVKSFVQNYIQQFSKYKVIITDRYHGTIFSLIANTLVIVIKTKDHKVSTGVDWFKGIYDGSVYYVEDINKIPEFVKELLAKYVICNNSSYFEKQYYNKLKLLIENVLGGNEV